MKVNTVPRKKEHKEHIEIFNGQVYEQKEFPYCKIVILMLVRIEGELKFCRAGFSDNQVPLIKTTLQGKWMFSQEELIKHLKEYKFTYVGSAKIEIQELIRFPNSS